MRSGTPTRQEVDYRATAKQEAASRSSGQSATSAHTVPRTGDHRPGRSMHSQRCRLSWLACFAAGGRRPRAAKLRNDRDLDNQADEGCDHDHRAGIQSASASKMILKTVRPQTPLSWTSFDAPVD